MSDRPASLNLSNWRQPEHGAWAEGPTLDQQMSAEKLKRQTGWKAERESFLISLSSYG